jgi:hypothetical protein
MGFEEKLNQMCVSGDREAAKELVHHTKSIARLVAAVLKVGKLAALPIKTQEILTKASEDAREAARIGDAAEYVYTRLLADRASVVDIKMRLDLRQVQDQIYALFDEKEAPARGFVYVAWSGHPERFMYVGKAANASRLNLTQHGLLANAAAHATTLSLLFPSQSRKQILLDLEASVIALIESWTGGLPELNHKRETVPICSPSKELSLLAAFFNSVAADLDPGAF